jgi:hypothetical protein
LRFTGNQVILDLPRIDLSKKEQDTVIRYLETLLQEDEEEPIPTSMSLKEKIRFLLENRDKIYILSGNVEIITRANNEVVSLTNLDVDGDMKFHSLDSASKMNRGFLSEAHQLVVRLYMKHWQMTVTQTGVKISLIVNTLNSIQLYSSLIGIASYLGGWVTNTPGYMVFSAAPFVFTVILAVIKRNLGSGR